MTTEYEALQESLTKLRLSNIRTNLTALLDSERLQDVSLTGALQILTTFELQSRKQNVRQQRIKRAHFPYLKTFEDFDFSYQSSLDKQQILELNTLRFMCYTPLEVDGRNNIISSSQPLGNFLYAKNKTFSLTKAQPHSVI